MSDPRKIDGRGGWRPGAGRKRAGGETGVAHRPRPALAPRFPVKVSTQLAGGLPSVRRCVLYRRVERVLFALHRRRGFRVVHFSVRRGGVHLLVEAKDKVALSRGMQSFKIRLALAINRQLRRARGTVFADRYRMRILKTPAAVRDGLRAVLLGARRPGPSGGKPAQAVDPLSSGRYFDGWRESIGPPPGDDACPVQPAGTALLERGWRRAQGGRISLYERHAA